MTTFLAIDTSSQACSVALLNGTELIENFRIIPRLHAQQIMPMIDHLLAETQCSINQLDAIAFARGPGSFTGIRIATSIAQGLAFGADLPVLPISSLAALAQGVCREHHEQQVLTALDARMGEIYWGCYELKNELVELVGDECLTPPEAFAPVIDNKSESQWVAAGDGWLLADKFPELVSSVSIRYESYYPHASDVARLASRDFAAGIHLSAEHAQPAYLRGKSAWRKSS